MHCLPCVVRTVVVLWGNVPFQRWNVWWTMKQVIEMTQMAASDYVNRLQPEEHEDPKGWGSTKQQATIEPSI